MIGLARRILDSMLMWEGHSNLSDEVLCTLMAEVTAIINSRPLVPVSLDADSPLILTPAMLLTQKAVSSPPAGDFSEKDIYKRQWRQVQIFYRFTILVSLETGISANAASSSQMAGPIPKH